VIYAVCTSCPFLRAYSSGAGDRGQLDVCPACGGELIVHEHLGRFPPAYVSRLSLDLIGAPELESEPLAERGVVDDERAGPPLRAVHGPVGSRDQVRPAGDPGLTE
jgi:hypothetical protein